MVLIAWTRQHLSFQSSLIAENPIKFPSKLACRRRSRRIFINSGKIIILFPNRISVIFTLTACHKVKWLALCLFSKWSTWHEEHHIVAISHRIVLNQIVGMNFASVLWLAQHKTFFFLILPSASILWLAQTRLSTCDSLYLENLELITCRCRLITGAMPPFNYTGHLHT